MNVHIENIGPLKNTTINCDGLTVITGKNRSGKSTIVKTLASIYLGVDNFVAHSIDDAYDYVRESIKDCFGILMFMLDFDDKERGMKKLKTFPHLSELLYSEGKLFDYLSLTETIDKTISEIDKHEDEFYSLFKKSDMRFRHFTDESNDNPSLKDELILRLQKCKKVIESFFAKGPGYYINEELSLVFTGQVENKYKKDKEQSLVMFSDANKKIFKHVYDDYSRVDNFFPYRKCFYINNSDILDYISKNVSSRLSYQRKRHGGTLNPYIRPLNDLLISTLSTKKKPVEEQENLSAYKETLDIINSVVDYDFIFDSSGLAITTNGGIALANEASGTKTFLLLKRLIMSGSIDNGALLMFDEPENHLHPEWQEVFARVIISLVKNTNVDIIVITHSPTLLLAFDVMSKENKINTNIYCSKNNNKTGFDFIDVTNNIEEAHQELNNTYINLDLLGE